MRRRAKRDLFTLLGVVFIVGAVFGVNTYMRLDNLKEIARKARIELEQKYIKRGYELVDWDMLQKTKGTYYTGAKFPDQLKSLDGELVNLVGFMMPTDQFRNITEFMLLPVPLTCYFCARPPMRDVVQVLLDTPAKEMVNEPVIVGGTLEVHEGAKQMFFYTIKNAKWNQPVDTTRKLLDETHKADHVQGFKDLRGEGQPEMEEGYAPPTLDSPGGTGPALPQSAPGGHTPEVDMGELQEPMETVPSAPSASEGAASP